VIERLKAGAKKLKEQISVIYYAYKNPETGVFPRILIWITLAYALSPVDLIPDFIPVIGYLDDLIILPALIILTIRLIPDAVMQDARRKAADKPVELNKNPFFAVIFVILWVAALAAVVKAVTGYFRT